MDEQSQTRRVSLPSIPVFVQLAGGAVALVGMHGKFGLWVTLIVGGVAAVILGALKESKRI